MTATLLILPGDGVGPEVIGQARRVLDWFIDRQGLEVEVREALYGLPAYAAHGALIDEATLAETRRADAILFGATGGPGYDEIPTEVRRAGSLLRLRRELKVYTNLRPITAWPALAAAVPLKAETVRDVDMMVVRELNGGIYFGQPRGIDGDEGAEVATNTLTYATAEIERIARAAFALARSRKGRLTSVDKSNVLETSALWRRVVSRVGGEEFPDVALEHILVDNCAMQIVRDPRQFDVLLADNMFGDILSDIGGAIAGSLGMLPSASLAAPADAATARQAALYEPVHGSAPDIAGQGIANPLGAILSLAMAFRHTFSRPDAAARLEAAVATALAGGARTPDIAAAGEAAGSTAAMGDAVLAALDTV